MKIILKDIMEQYNELQSKEYDKNIKLGLFRSYSIEMIEKTLFVTNASREIGTEYTDNICKKLWKKQATFIVLML